MPYITKEEVKEKRNLIKKAFPKFKFSVTCKNYSTIDVTILSGPMDLLKGTSDTYVQVNTYYIKEHYKDRPEVAGFLETIKSLANKGNYTASVDGDYGNIPSFYTHLNIGDWDKPYLLTN